MSGFVRSLTPARSVGIHAGIHGLGSYGADTLGGDHHWGPLSLVTGASNPLYRNSPWKIGVKH